VYIMGKRSKKLLGLSVLLLALLGFILWQNNDLVVSFYDLEVGLDEEINIVHLSDLHGKEYGENNAELVALVKEQSPDLIFFTGDLVDQDDDDIDGKLDYLADLRALAPVYVVFGNHEYWLNLEEDIKTKLTDLHIRVLDNEAIYMNVKGHHIQLIGLSDEASGEEIAPVFEELVNPSMYNIVLYHQPNALDLFTEYEVDLVFSGHAHGGQIRLPFVGGLYAPNQGLFPTYTSGLYEQEDTRILVSRGLANSVIPVRIFNRPEILVVTID